MLERLAWEERRTEMENQEQPFTQSRLLPAATSEPGWPSSGLCALLPSRAPPAGGGASRRAARAGGSIAAPGARRGVGKAGCRAELPGSVSSTQVTLESTMALTAACLRPPGQGLLGAFPCLASQACAPPAGHLGQVAAAPVHHGPWPKQRKP